MAQYSYSDEAGYYDFMHYLFSVGTRKYIYVALSSGGSSTVYTVPSGKKAYILWINVGDYYTDTSSTGYFEIYDSSDALQFHVEFGRGGSTIPATWSPNGQCLIELDEGWYIYVKCTNNYVRFNMFVIEVSK